MEHYAFPDIATFLAKHDRYSSWEAAALLKMDEADKNSLRATPFGTPLERKRWLRNLAVKVPFRGACDLFITTFGSEDFVTATAAGCSVACSRHTSA
jgi:hypothetical protein